MADMTLEEAFREIAKSWGLPPDILKAIAATEVGGEPNPLQATNRLKTVGLFQMTPIYMKEHNISREEALDPLKSAALVASILVKEAKKFNGDLSKAILAHNAGISKIRKWEQGKVELSPGVKNYLINVERIMKGETPLRAPGKAFNRLMQTPVSSFYNFSK